MECTSIILRPRSLIYCEIGMCVGTFDRYFCENIQRYVSKFRALHAAILYILQIPYFKLAFCIWRHYCVSVLNVLLFQHVIRLH
jgi:hypothetical protein